MKLLVVGLGSIGRRHVDNLYALGVTDLIAWRVGNQPFPEPGRWDGIPVFATLEAALAEGPKAVLVCNPPACHVPVAIDAARAGCHLFIEKPLSDGLQRVEELRSLTAARRLVVLVGFNLRFHPGLRMLKRWIDDGRVGRVLSIRAQAGQYLPDWHPWADHRRGYSARQELGGGVILDLIHELDYVRWLGGEVSEVGCMTGAIGGVTLDTEDIAEIVLRFESGAIGSVHLDYLQRRLSRSCSVIGTVGTATWDGVANRLEIATGDRAPEVLTLPPHDRNQTFLDEMEHFLQCLNGRAEPIVDMDEAIRSQRLAIAAREAAREQRVRTT
jgi:predicted dehydrogenase